MSRSATDRPVSPRVTAAGPLRRWLRWGALATTAVAVVLVAWQSGALDQAPAAGDAGAARGGAPARGPAGGPPGRVTRREPVAEPGAPTLVSGRLRTTLEARVRATLAGCASHEVGAPLVRVVVTLDAVVAERVRLDGVALRGGHGAVAGLESCLARELAAVELEVPEGASAGRFPVTISTMVEIAAATVSGS